MLKRNQMKWIDICPPEEKTFQRTKNTLAVKTDSFTWVPDNTIDFILTDPPFNIAQDTNFHTYNKNTVNSYRFDGNKGWDTYTKEEFVKLLNVWSVEFERVLRPGGNFAIFCADIYLSHLMNALKTNGLKPRRAMTWRKPNAMPVNRQTMMMSACEYLIVGVKGSNAVFNSTIPLSELKNLGDVEQTIIADKAANVVEKAVKEAIGRVNTRDDSRPEEMEKAVKAAVENAAKQAGERVKAMYVEEGTKNIFRACIPNYVSFNSKTGNRLHPTEKPVELLRYLIALLSVAEATVLDPFGGSGAVGQAGVELNRKVIVIEKDGEYYEKLAVRLNQLPGQ